MIRFRSIAFFGLLVAATILGFGLSKSHVVKADPSHSPIHVASDTPAVPVVPVRQPANSLHAGNHYGVTWHSDGSHTHDGGVTHSHDVPGEPPKPTASAGSRNYGS